jgi:protein-tyrosine phosphatase
MDWDNQALTESLCPPAHIKKVRRLAEFFQRFSDTVVPDPYYGGPEDFERVLDLVEDGTEGLMALCRRRLELT